jgi:Tfp pilus assembly protein PilN
MITLNLLREKKERFLRKRILFRLIVLYFGGLAFILMIAGLDYYSTASQIERTRNTIHHLREKMSSEHILFQQFENYHKELGTLNRKLSLCLAEKNSRTLWTEKLILIADALPQEMWIGKIFLQQSGDTKKNRTLFVIEGFIDPLVSERKTLATFMNRLDSTTQQHFSSISLKKVVRTREKRPEENVVSFTIECIVLPPGGSSL